MGAGTEGIKCNRCGGTELEKVLSVIARTRAVATGSEPCEVSGGCPMGGCGHGCGELD